MDTMKIDMFLGQSESKGQIEGEIQLPTDKNDIEKIYNVFCNINVREKNVDKDVIRLNGDAEFTIYYITSQNACDSFTAVSAFSHELDAKGISPEHEVSLLWRIEDSGAVILDSRTVKANATVDFVANVTQKGTMPDLETGSLQTRRVPACARYKEQTINHPFHMSTEMRIPGGMEQIENIVGTRCYGIINGIKKDGQNAICFGDLFLNTIYCSKEGMWQICDSFPFEEIVDCNMSLDDKELIGCIDVKKATATAYDPDVISYSVSAVIKMDIMCGLPYGVVVDAYSLSHNIDAVKSHINMKSPVSTDASKYTFRASTKTGNIEKPLCIVAMPVIKGEFAMEGTVSIEGSLICDMVFQKDDGRIDCTKITLPIDESVPVPGIKEDFDVWTQINVQKASAVISGDEMEIRCPMDVSVHAFSSEEYDVIQSVEEREPLNREGSSIMIYFKDEDEDVFDIAKTYHISMDDINTSDEKKLILINPVC